MQLIFPKFDFGECVTAGICKPSLVRFEHHHLSQELVHAKERLRHRRVVLQNYFAHALGDSNEQHDETR
jgi:hypothetical protein